jgi:hypothetical protein
VAGDIVLVGTDFGTQFAGTGRQHDRPHLAHLIRSIPSLPIGSPKMIAPSRGITGLSSAPSAGKEAVNLKGPARE